MGLVVKEPVIKTGARVDLKLIRQLVKAFTRITQTFIVKVEQLNRLADNFGNASAHFLGLFPLK